MARLKEQYQNEIVDALMKKFGYKNVMQVPKLDKIVINMGVGEAKENAKVLDSAVRDLKEPYIGSTQLVSGEIGDEEVLTLTHLMAEETMLLVSRSS